ncbi:hypothetical protein WH95_19530 [Kiloniella litopenaei]|uniref:Uncharacterized protein n=1 Tax=Kiloniella litopenaei TaxID=1549748 RepID=A0A0M2R6R8_9PROT|nr:hypothetical protein WH95_19530 [Kiloniella litopenaei]
MLLLSLKKIRYLMQFIKSFCQFEVSKTLYLVVVKYINFSTNRSRILSTVHVLFVVVFFAELIMIGRQHLKNEI